MVHYPDVGPVFSESISESRTPLNNEDCRLWLNRLHERFECELKRRSGFISQKGYSKNERFSFRAHSTEKEQISFEPCFQQSKIQKNTSVEAFEVVKTHLGRLVVKIPEVAGRWRLFKKDYQIFLLSLFGKACPKLAQSGKQEVKFNHAFAF